MANADHVLDLARRVADPDVEPLDRLTAARRLQQVTPELVRELGLSAREAGATWRQIADAGDWTSTDAAEAALRDAEAREAARRRAKRHRGPGKTAGLPGVGVAEAARRLGIQRHQVYALVERGELVSEKHTTPGGKTLNRIVAGLPGQDA